MRFLICLLLLPFIVSCQRIEVSTYVLDLEAVDISKISMKAISLFESGSRVEVEEQDSLKIERFMVALKKSKRLKSRFPNYRKNSGFIVIGFHLKNGQLKHANMIFTCNDGIILGMGAFSEDMNIDIGIKSIIEEYGTIKNTCKP